MRAAAVDRQARAALLRAMRREASDAGKLARFRAAQLIEIAGPDASWREIARAARRRYSRMPRAQRRALVEFTLEYRATPDPPTERRIDPSTVDWTGLRTQREEDTVARARLTEKEEARVRAACERALREDPDASAAEVRAQLAKEGLVVDGRGFSARFWMPAMRAVGLIDGGQRNGKTEAPPPPPSPAEVSIEAGAPAAAEISPPPPPADPGPDAEIVRGPDRTAAGDAPARPTAGDAPARPTAEARLRAVENDLRAVAVDGAVPTPSAGADVSGVVLESAGLADGMRIVPLGDGQCRIELCETVDRGTAYRLAAVIAHGLLSDGGDWPW